VLEHREALYSKIAVMTIGLQMLQPNRLMMGGYPNSQNVMGGFG
jgi:hypothetical protein